ncbi:MAG TPA: amidophosphoribosyltransferase [Terriglobales bacterium]|nr:amidophosphoribosyltransferase [Terriglobales bacterium]
MFDKFHEECGVVGVFGHPEASNLVYLSLYALQHRGQEAAGIVSSKDDILISHRGLGLVADVFDEDIIRKLEGNAAIGHNRYSTSGGTQLKNTQPFVVEYEGGGLAVAHNGNLINSGEIRKRLQRQGSIFQSNVDSEVFVHLIATASGETTTERVIEALLQVRGAYSLVFLTPHELIAVRDPSGFRPLVMGRLDQGVIFASETCALDLLGATYEREVEPGEMVRVSAEGVESFHPFPKMPTARCVFEYIYFARPDSQIYDRNVYEVRKELGRQLAREQPADADIVIPVPDSGLPAALGYAEEAGLPFEMGLVRNHYVGRTFIEPRAAIRHFGVKVKLNAQSGVLKDKRVVVVDDSIVRGTTSRKIVEMLRNAGAREVHMRISSPPTVSSCFYGIDTPTREELIASSHSVEEICKFITADSLGYLSPQGMYSFLEKRDGNGFCDACFTGRYPIPPEEEGQEVQLRLFEAGDR